MRARALAQAYARAVEADDLESLFFFSGGPFRQNRFSNARQVGLVNKYTYRDG